jgi:hypothetical protein
VEHREREESLLRRGHDDVQDQRHNASHELQSLHEVTEK